MAGVLAACVESGLSDLGGGGGGGGAFLVSSIFNLSSILFLFCSCFFFFSLSLRRLDIRQKFLKSC